MTSNPARGLRNIFLAMCLGACVSSCYPPRPLQIERGSICDNIGSSDSLPDFVRATQADLNGFKRKTAPSFRAALSSFQAIRASVATFDEERGTLLWEQGDRFPSIRLSDGLDSQRIIRLDPVLRRQNIQDVSRITISPGQLRAAIVARPAGENSSLVIVIDFASSGAITINLRAYDLAWLTDEELLISEEQLGLPAKLFRVRLGSEPNLIERAKNPAEAILLHPSRQSNGVFVEHALPLTTSIDLYIASTSYTPKRLLDSEPRGAKCVMYNRVPFCLSYRDSSSGHIIRLNASGGVQREAVATADESAPYIDLLSDTNHLLGIVSRGTRSEIRIIRPETPPPASVVALGPVTTFAPRAAEVSRSERSLVERSFLTTTRPMSLSDLRGSSDHTSPAVRRDCLGCSEFSWFATSADGASIPISVLAPERPRALMIQAYGAYGVSSYAEFSPAFISLANHGVAVAIAHVRGGGEFGPSWHTGAIGEKKLRAVADLLAVTEHLQKQLGVSGGRTILSGRSAGGWLVSKAAVSQPRLYAGLILDAPLVELLDVVMDSQLPLHAREVVEWGTNHAVLLAHSPSPPSAPMALNILIRVPMRDRLIPPEGTLRWALRAYCAQTPDTIFALEMARDEGHAGPSSISDQDNWNALKESFILEVVDRAP